MLSRQWPAVTINSIIYTSCMQYASCRWQSSGRGLTRPRQPAVSESSVTACDDTWLTAPMCVHFDTYAQMYSWRVSSEILWKSEGHPVERSGGTSNFDPLVEAICRDVEARLACTTTTAINASHLRQRIHSLQLLEHSTHYRTVTFSHACYIKTNTRTTQF